MRCWLTEKPAQNWLLLTNYFLREIIGLEKNEKKKEGYSGLCDHELKIGKNKERVVKY